MHDTRQPRLSTEAERATDHENVAPIKNPEMELNHPAIPEVIAVTSDVREPKLHKHFLHIFQQLRKQGFRVTMLEAYDQITRLITGAPTVRFSQFNERLTLGGQYTARGWKRLNSRGVTAAVNMRGEYDEAKEGFAPDRYCHLPTVDNHAPTLDHLHKGVRFIHDTLMEGGKVYIHCWEGVGRAPTMLAAYLISTGLKPSEAWAQIKAVRPFIRPSVVQIQQIDRFAAEWVSEDTIPLSARLRESLKR